MVGLAVTQQSEGAIKCLYGGSGRQAIAGIVSTGITAVDDAAVGSRCVHRPTLRVQLQVVRDLELVNGYDNRIGEGAFAGRGYYESLTRGFGGQLPGHTYGSDQGVATSPIDALFRSLAGQNSRRQLGGFTLGQGDGFGRGHHASDRYEGGEVAPPKVIHQCVIGTNPVDGQLRSGGCIDAREQERLDNSAKLCAHRSQRIAAYYDLNHTATVAGSLHRAYAQL